MARLHDTGVRPPGAALRRAPLDLDRVWTAAALVSVVAAAVIAGAWAGRAAAPAAPAVAEPLRSATIGPARLAIPAAWQPAALAGTGLAGLARERTVAFAIAPGASAHMLVTLAPADHASLVPAPLRRALRGPLPPPRATELAGRPAWSYTRLRTRRLDALEITVQPTTAGVLAVACTAPAAAGCSGAVASVSVRGARTLLASPSAALTLRLPDVVADLDRARVGARKRLRGAETPAARTRLARRLAAHHRTAAAALRPVAGPGGGPLLAALDVTADAYATLARAATGGSSATAKAAATLVAAADAQLTAAVDAARRSAAPRPAPAPPAVSAAAATDARPAFPSKLLMILSPALALGAGLAVGTVTASIRPATPGGAAPATAGTAERVATGRAPNGQEPERDVREQQPR